MQELEIETETIIKPNNCNKKECIIKWNKETNQTQEQEDADWENGINSVHHCDNTNCHEIYWRNTKGQMCKICKIQYCETCSYYLCTASIHIQNNNYYCYKCLKKNLTINNI